MRSKNIFLVPLYDDINRLMDTFQHSFVHHVYCELNKEADLLSKKGLLLVNGSWHKWVHEGGGTCFTIAIIFWDLRV